MAARVHPLLLLLVVPLACFLHLVSASSPAAPSSFRSLPRPAAAVAANGRLARTVSAARTCWYTVRIKTSCASPRRTADAVSLAFGDAYRDEVYAAALGGSGALERCATDTFRIGGPCGYGVCYLYLRRAGRDGWTPEWVRVYEPAAAGAPSTFYYGEPLPNNVWYGFDRCPHRSSTPSSAAAAASSSSTPSSSSAAAAAAAQAI